MSDIDIDQLLESLGDFTNSQAKEFVAALGAEIGVKQPKQQAEPQEQPDPNLVALEA